jgi:hypothetical protein
MFAAVMTAPRSFAHGIAGVPPAALAPGRAACAFDDWTELEAVVEDIRRRKLKRPKPGDGMNRLDERVEGGGRGGAG